MTKWENLISLWYVDMDISNFIILNIFNSVNTYIPFVNIIIMIDYLEIARQLTLMKFTSCQNQDKDKRSPNLLRMV